MSGQSRIGSAVEACANTLSGYVLSVLTWRVISGPVLHAPFETGQAMYICAIFTIVSVIRSYIWRRIFNRRIRWSYP